MINRTVVTAFALLAIAMFAAPLRKASMHGTPQAAAEPPKFALLVGVNKYKEGSDIRTLEGAHNDVALMKGLLAEFGFKEDASAAGPTEAAPCGEQKAGSGVRTLCSQQATKRAILDAFDSHLLKNAESYWKGAAPDPSKGPAIVFYYSGHGSQVEDRRPIEGEKESDLRVDEADGLDESLVPHDSDSAGTRDIRDDSFEERIAKLKRFTANITFIADSCHSGTITRGGGIRGIERKFDGLPAAAATRGGGAGDGMFADGDYVTLSGSLPTQFSFERWVPNPATKENQLNGLLTYHFAAQVRQNPGASYREVINLVRNAITAAGERQTPQAEGDVDRPVFGSRAPRGKRAIALKCRIEDERTVCSDEVRKLGEDGTVSTGRKVELDAGEMVGARPGGAIVIYAPGAKTLAGDEGKIATGTITSADAFRSEAEVVLADAKATDLPPLAKVVLVSPAFRDSKRVVAVDAPVVANALRDNPYVTAVEETNLLAKLNPDANGARGGSGDWEIAVVRATYADFKAGRAPSAAAASKDAGPPAAQAGYFIAGRSGTPLYDMWVPADAPDAAGRLRRALEAHVKAENLRAMANEASTLKGKLKVEMVKHKGITGEGNVCRLIPYGPGEAKRTAGGDERIRRSEAFHLRITNDSEMPLLIYIWSVDAAGEISLLYPAKGAQETISPGGALVTNGANPCYTYAFADDAPVGFETIKVIASEQPIQADLLTQPGIGASRNVRLSPLDRLLRQAGGNTRGPQVYNGNVSDWVAVDLNYIVER